MGDVHDEQEVYIDRSSGMKNTKSKVQFADGKVSSCCWGKVIFSQASVILSTEGGGGIIPACIVGGGYPSMPCSRSPGGVLSQHALQQVYRGCLLEGGWSAPVEGGLILGRWVCSRGEVPGGDPPGRLLLRAVRILLECILVFSGYGQ